MVILTVQIPFQITNRAGDRVLIPKKYKLKGLTRCITEDNVEYLTILAEADSDKIEETTEIRKIPWRYVSLVDE